MIMTRRLIVSIGNQPLKRRADVRWHGLSITHPAQLVAFLPIKYIRDASPRQPAWRFSNVICTIAHCAEGRKREKLRGALACRLFVATLILLQGKRASERARPAVIQGDLSEAATKRSRKWDGSREIYPAARPAQKACVKIVAADKKHKWTLSGLC
jgi:hypothetical protein